MIFSGILTLIKWRNFIVYNSMKKLIGKHFYKTAEEAQQKIDVFFATNRLSDDEYVELSALIQEIYGE